MYTHQGTMLIFTAAHYRLMSKTTILFILHGVIYIYWLIRQEIPMCKKYCNAKWIDKQITWSYTV